MDWKLRLVLAALLIGFVALQYRLWVGQGSVAEVRQLEQQIAAQQAELLLLRDRNAALRADVEDLREGLEAVEALARDELGMIRDGETFFQVIPAQAAPAGD